MKSKATTVAEYLRELPADRRAALTAVRRVILENLDDDYEEGMQYGMIGYYVPHRVYPAGYHCDPKQPLPFVGLASQKNYMSLYLSCLYSCAETSRWFQAVWAKTGKKLDAGKCCLRFRKLDDLALDAIGQAIRRVPVKKCIEQYESALAAKSTSSSRGKPTTRKASTATRPGKTTKKKSRGGNKR